MTIGTLIGFLVGIVAALLATRIKGGIDRATRPRVSVEAAVDRLLADWRTPRLAERVGCDSATLLSWRRRGFIQRPEHLAQLAMIYERHVGPANVENGTRKPPVRRPKEDLHAATSPGVEPVEHSLMGLVEP